METNTRLAATVLLLLHLGIFCDAAAVQSPCEGQICHISPNNFGQMQKAISSNRIIILSGVHFHVNHRNDFIGIENMSNLTISSEEVDSLIECSPLSTFGLHLKNSTNVILMEIRIRNCGAAIPDHIMPHKSSSQTTLLIESSRNVTLSKVHIEYSPDIALTLLNIPIDKNFEDLSSVVDNGYPNLTYTDYNICCNREGSIVINETTSLLMEETIIANSDYGVMSFHAEILIKNLDVINCTSSHMEGGYGKVRKMLTITNSSLTICNQDLYISGNLNATFSSVLDVIGSNISVRENSVAKTSHYKMNLRESRVQLRYSTTLTFSENTARLGQAIIYLYHSHMDIIESSSLIISNNTLTNTTEIIRCFNSFINVSGGVVLFVENKSPHHSHLVKAGNATTVILEKGSSIKFTHNTVVDNSSIFFFDGGLMVINESSLVIAKNLVTNDSHGLLSNKSAIFLNAGILLFKKNEIQQYSMLMETFDRTTTLESRSLMNFTQNTAYNMSLIYASKSVNLDIHNSSVVFTNNSGTGDSFGMLLKFTNITFENESFLHLAHNQIENIFISLTGLWNMSSDSMLVVLDNLGRHTFSFVHATFALFAGRMKIANNTFSYQGFVSSKEVRFSGSLEVVGNRGIETGGIYAFNSDIFITGTALFSDNQADSGGAMTLITSVMHISPKATVNFTRNYAHWLGGAIYISEPRIRNIYMFDISCSIVLLPDSSSDICQLFSLSFNQNRAGTAGNAIYGGRTSACLPCEDCEYGPVTNIFQYNGVNDTSDLSNFTSDPTRACFCEKGIPNCNKILNNITVHPGESFNISLVLVGYGYGTVPGSVIARESGGKGVSEQSVFGSKSEYAQEVSQLECQSVGYSVVSERDKEQFALTVQTSSFAISLEETRKLVNSKISNNLYLLYHSYNDFFHIPVFVDVQLLPCPVGFQLVGGKCICQEILLDNNIDACFFFNGTPFILRPAHYWIGLYNDTNPSFLIHSHCPFDYCQLENIKINADTYNIQCQNHRSGVLCGSCHEGLSMILGSSECKTCSNVYLVSISFFALVGVALVAILILLNMTVSVGTLNGLILLANILQANRTTFLPPTTSHTSALIAFLGAFISWLNLDLGIPMCFFEGLTTYFKTWLQFVFPLYILALVGGIILVSSYSIRVTRLFGTYSVSVLATLILLSYTKILRLIITAFSFTIINGSQGYHSVVWLADGNIKYFDQKHTILFLVALVVLLLLGIPYTLTLTTAPWIQRSRFRLLSSLYNRFKPLFDAYMGPYKDNDRYWTGMLLLVRVVLIVLFSSISNTNTVAGPQLNHLLLSLTSCALVGFTAVLKPYKNKLLNGLEIFHLTILFIFSSTNLYVSNFHASTGPRGYIYIVLVGICFLVFLGISVGHIWYRVHKTWIGRRPEPPEREEENYRPMFWQTAKGRAEDEDEEREDVTLSTAGASNVISDRGRRESLVELIAADDIPQ